MLMMQMLHSFQVYVVSVIIRIIVVVHLVVSFLGMTTLTTTRAAAAATDATSSIYKSHILRTINSNIKTNKFDSTNICYMFTVVLVTLKYEVASSNQCTVLYNCSNSNSGRNKLKV